MCGHGTIGTVTVLLEQELVTPRTPGLLRLEVPAGRVDAHYTQQGKKVTSVRFVNVPSFLHTRGIQAECPGLGTLAVDVAYGGNFYGIIDPQRDYRGLDEFSVGDVLRYSPDIRQRINDSHTFIHPLDPTIRGLSHIQWTGPPHHPEAQARNAVFYGEKAIDRSPCGTGTSARMAQWAAEGKLKKGDSFVHESIIGSLFRGTVEDTTRVGQYDAIIPSIEGWAVVTGYNTIFINDDDPYKHGFQVL